jgi:hypothetical protein
VNDDLKKYATMNHSYVLSYQILHFQQSIGLVLSCRQLSGYGIIVRKRPQPGRSICLHDRR